MLDCIIITNETNDLALLNYRFFLSAALERLFIINTALQIRAKQSIL